MTKPQRKFLTWIFEKWVMLPVRHNFLNLFRYGDAKYSEKSIRHQFSRSINFPGWFDVAFGKLRQKECIAAFDPSGAKYDEKLFKASSKCISSDKTMRTMIDGIQYIEIVKLFFSFLITELGFRLSKETENGNVFYDIEYSDVRRVVSISYENIEDYLQVIVFKLKNGKLPDYDDKTHTLHLNELNKKVLSEIDKKEIEKNNEEFNKFDVNDELERKLLKSAKELRLVLKYWDKV